MKVFVSQVSPKGYVSELDYNWCDDGEILMFGQFQGIPNINPKDVSMCGVNTRKFTTRITVKELDISKEFLTEII